MLAADQTFTSLADLFRAAAPRPPEAHGGNAASEFSPALLMDVADALRTSAQDGTTATSIAGPGDSDAANSGEHENDVPATARVAGDVHDPGSNATHRCRCSDAPEQTRAAIREARFFGAALADAFDRLGGRLARGLANAVLARELQLEPAQIATIAQRLISDSLAEEPVRLRVAPGDADFICALPVTVDPGLVVGDAILECRSGSIDARLNVRLALVLAELGA